jgi:hypothetical protein
MKQKRVCSKQADSFLFSLKAISLLMGALGTRAGQQKIIARDITAAFRYIHTQRGGHNTDTLPHWQRGGEFRARLNPEAGHQ